MHFRLTAPPTTPLEDKVVELQAEAFQEEMDETAVTVRTDL